MLTVDAVAEALEKIVASKPEGYVYKRTLFARCLYADPDDGTPSCIVGHVLADLAPEVFSRLAEYEREEGGISLPAVEALDYYAEDTPPLVRDALQAAQEVQDAGGTWQAAKWAYNEVVSSGIDFEVHPDEFYRIVSQAKRGI